MGKVLQAGVDAAAAAELACCHHRRAERFQLCFLPGRGGGRKAQVHAGGAHGALNQRYGKGKQSPAGRTRAGRASYDGKRGTA